MPWVCFFSRKFDVNSYYRIFKVFSGQIWNHISPTTTTNKPRKRRKIPYFIHHALHFLGVEKTTSDSGGIGDETHNNHLWWNFQVMKRCATLCIPGSPSQLWASVRRCLSTLKTRCFLWFCKQVCVSSTHPGISDFKPWSEVKVSEKPSPTKVHP